MARAAEIAGMEHDYNTMYRGLSNDSCHPSILALNRHIIADENNVISGVKLNLTPSDIENTLLTACSAYLSLLAYAMEILGHEEYEELWRCSEEYKRLINAVIESNSQSEKENTSVWPR